MLQCYSGCIENNSASYFNFTFYLSGCPGNYPGLRASPFFPRFNEDLGSLSISSWHFGAVASQMLLLSRAVPSALAFCVLADCGRQHGGAACVLGRGQVGTGRW